MLLLNVYCDSINLSCYYAAGMLLFKVYYANIMPLLILKVYCAAVIRIAALIAQCEHLRLLHMLLCCYYEAITVCWRGLDNTRRK